MISIFRFTLLLLVCSPILAEEPMVVAHRGASKDAPENTIPAFKLAWEQGADAIEGDFHLTKDGVVVCIHDGNTKKVAGTKLEVSSTPFDELRKLDVGGSREPFRGTNIPTLAEVLTTVPDGKKIFIEIKCGPEIIPAMLTAVEQSGLKQEQIVFISFNEKVLGELKTKAPQYKASWLCSFKKQKSGEITPSTETVLEKMKANRIDALSSNADVSQATIDAIKEQRYEWHVWTINKVEVADRMVELGVKSVTTDVPAQMKKHLLR